MNIPSSTSNSLPRTMGPACAASPSDFLLSKLLSSPSSTSAPRVPTPGLRLEVLRGSPGLLRLESHWDELLDQSAVRTPFMRWDWTEIWWRHFEADYQAVFGAAWAADGTLVALVPLVIGPGQTAARRHLRHLAFFAGLGEVVAEGLDCLALAGHEQVLAALFDRVFEEIQGEWDTAQFGFVDDASPFRPFLHQALRRHGANLEATNLQASPMARFGDGGWDAYLMERSGSFRKKLKRSQATATEAHQMSFREASHAAEVPAFVETLMELHAERWTAEQSLFLHPKARAFHLDLAKRWCASRRAVLMVMDFQDAPVAANYAFTDGDRMWDYQGGWKREFIDLSPSKLITAENFRRGCELGLREIDLLPGDLEYKSKWSRDQRQLADLEAVNPASMRARIFHSIRAVKRLVSRISITDSPPES